MNRSYRTIFSRATETWIAVAENVCARTKAVTSTGVVRGSFCSLGAGKRALLAATVAQALLGPAWALDSNTLPTGGQVTSGSASITQSGNQMVIQQSTEKAILNWQSFSIGANAGVRFDQPSVSAWSLNRVMGSNPSEIAGSLSSNGRVILSNPLGVLFTGSSRVDVGALIATTQRISDEDFQAGRYRFVGESGRVVNQGDLHAKDGGFIALLAPEVRNEGVIAARLGSVVLAAGGVSTLTLQTDGSDVGIGVDPALVKTLVENRHIVMADGGRVWMAASAAKALEDSVIRNSGVVSAQRIENQGGEIWLTASDVDNSGLLSAQGLAQAQRKSDGGTVVLQGQRVALTQGSINVSSDSGRAGAVVLSGERVGLFGATVDGHGRNGGGRVVIGGDSLAKVTDITPVQFASLTLVDANSRVDIGSSNGDGGFVETSGHNLQMQGRVVGTAAGNAGQWLIDPTDITISTGVSTAYNLSNVWNGTAAQSSAVVNNASIEAALNSGTYVTVTTASGNTSAAGNIAVAANIVKSGGTQATLTLQANGGIAVQDGVTIGVNATGGILDLNFSSANGSIAFLGNNSLSGRNITLTANNDNAADTSGYGVSMSNLAVNASGAVCITGVSSQSNGIEADASGTLAIRASSLVMNGTSTNNFGNGIVVIALNTNVSGDLSLSGTGVNGGLTLFGWNGSIGGNMSLRGNTTKGLGINLLTSVNLAVAGNADWRATRTDISAVLGRIGPRALYVADFANTSIGGDFTLIGTSVLQGTGLYAGTGNLSVSGNASLTGNGQTDAGVVLFTNITAGRALSVLGNSAGVTASDGVNITQVSLKGRNIDLVGTTNASGNAGISLNGVTATSTSGALNFTGTNSLNGSGVLFQSSANALNGTGINVIGNTTGDGNGIQITSALDIRGDSRFGSNTSINVAASLTKSGGAASTLTLQANDGIAVQEGAVIGVNATGGILDLNFSSANGSIAFLGNNSLSGRNITLTANNDNVAERFGTAVDIANNLTVNATGTVTFHGTSTQGIGVNISGLDLSAAALSVHGNSALASSVGVGMGALSHNVTGDVSIYGSGGAAGLAVYSGGVWNGSVGGNFSLSGTATNSGSGIDLLGNVNLSVVGNANLTGSSNSGPGARISRTKLGVSGDLLIQGNNSGTLGSGLSVGQNPDDVTLSARNITLLGQTSANSAEGVSLLGLNATASASVGITGLSSNGTGVGFAVGNTLRGRNVNVSGVGNTGIDLSGSPLSATGDTVFNSSGNLDLKLGSITVTSGNLTMAAGSAQAVGDAAGGEILNAAANSLQVANGYKVNLYTGNATKTVAEGLRQAASVGGTQVSNGTLNYNAAYGAITGNLSSPLNLFYRSAASFNASSASAQNRVYNGDTNVSINVSLDPASRIGGSTGDALVSNLLTVNGTVADKNAANNKSVTVGDVKVDVSNANFTGGVFGYTNISGFSGVTVNIGKANLSASGILAQDRTYNGKTNTSVSLLLANASLSGSVSGDSVSLSSVSGNTADGNANTNKSVSLSNWSLTGTDASNYQVSSASNVSVNISPATLNINGLRANDRPFTSPTDTNVTLNYNDISTNQIEGDEVSFSATGNSADGNIGSNKAVGLTNVGLSGADSGNYQLGSVNTVTVNITQTLTQPASPAASYARDDYTQSIQTPAVEIPKVVVQPASALAVATTQVNYFDNNQINQQLAQEMARRQERQQRYKDALALLESSPTAADIPPCSDSQNAVCMPTDARFDASRGDARIVGLGAAPVARKFAVMISAKNYQSQQIPSLDSTEFDAQKLGEVFGQVYGYEVIQLRDATKAGIVQTLKRLANQLEQNDSVVVFYAGHGYQSESGAGYWIPVDASATDARTWVSNNDITRLLGMLPAKQVALISDSCYSGTLVHSDLKTAFLSQPEAILDRRSVVTISSGGEEPVSDEGFEGHSVFAYHLLKTLEKPSTSVVTVDTLFDQIREAVTRDFPQTPQIGALSSAGAAPGSNYLLLPTTVSTLR